MPDDTTTQVTTEPTQTTEAKAPAAVAAAIPQEALAKIQAELNAEMKKEVEKLSSDKANKVLKEYQKQVASALGVGENSEDVRDRVLEKLGSDPVGFAASVARLAHDSTMAEIRRKDEQTAAEMERQREIAKASQAVFKSRPDLHGNERAGKVIDKFYEEADSSLSEKEKLEFALTQYDLLMESTGAGKAEDRIKAASPSHSAASPEASKTPPGKSQSELEKEYQLSRVERFRKSHGNKYPKAVSL